MLVSKRKNTIPEDLNICINDVNIKPKKLVKLLGITLDNKLNFENHISSICKSASCQLECTIKVKTFSGILRKEKFNPFMNNVVKWPNIL